MMLMGKIVSNKKYEFYEYLVAVLISLGMIAFMLGKESGAHSDSVTTVSGIIILVGYMSFDSFTSNWQDSLFKVLFSFYLTNVNDQTSVQKKLSSYSTLRVYLG